MKPVNEVKLHFPSRSANEGFARGVCAAFASQLDPTVDEVADLRTAVSEAVTNAIIHAYPDCIGVVRLHMKLFENGRMVVRVSDKGKGIPDVKRAMQPLFTTGGEERSGLGFSVMESFCDKVRVRSNPDRGTTVTLEKWIVRREMAKS